MLLIADTINIFH